MLTLPSLQDILRTLLSEPAMIQSMFSPYSRWEWLQEIRPHFTNHIQPPTIGTLTTSRNNVLHKRLLDYSRNPCASRNGRTPGRKASRIMVDSRSKDPGSLWAHRIVLAPGKKDSRSSLTPGLFWCPHMWYYPSYLSPRISILFVHPSSCYSTHGHSTLIGNIWLTRQCGCIQSFCSELELKALDLCPHHTLNSQYQHLQCPPAMSSNITPRPLIPSEMF